MHVLRFDDRFVGLVESETHAAEAVDRYRQLGSDDEHANRFSTQPAERFWIFCRGNHVDCVETLELATAHIEQNATELAPPDVWEVVDTDAPPDTPQTGKRPYKAPELRELSDEEVAVLKKRLEEGE